MFKNYFILASLILILLLPVLSQAQQQAVMIVSSSEGKAGEMVEIEVYLKGIANLTEVEGLSGGELELVYDPQVASIINASYIKRGDLIADHDEWLFMRNENFSDVSLKATWASLRNELVNQDGSILRITFLLNKDGIIQPAIKNLALYDQDVRPLQIGVESISPETGFPAVPINAPEPTSGEGETREPLENDLEESGDSGETEASDENGDPMPHEENSDDMPKDIDVDPGGDDQDSAEPDNDSVPAREERGSGNIEGPSRALIIPLALMLFFVCTLGYYIYKRYQE